MAKIVKPEPLSVLDVYSGYLCCRSQVVGDEYGRTEHAMKKLALKIAFEFAVIGYLVAIGLYFAPRKMASLDYSGTHPLPSCSSDNYS